MPSRWRTTALTRWASAPTQRLHFLRRAQCQQARGTLPQTARSSRAKERATGAARRSDHGERALQHWPRTVMTKLAPRALVCCIKYREPISAVQVSTARHCLTTGKYMTTHYSIHFFHVLSRPLMLCCCAQRTEALANSTFFDHRGSQPVP